MKKNNFNIVELKPKKDKNKIRRTVFIKNFIIQEIIGFHQHFHLNPQLQYFHKS